MNDSPTTPDDAHATRDDLLAAGPLLLKTGGLLLALFLGVVGVGFLLREPILALSCGFVERFGPLGIAFGFFIPDATNLPLPHDLFLMMGAASGMPIWQIVVAGSTGSILGGAAAYQLAARVRRVAWVRERLEARGGAVHRVVDEYGALAVAIGAITPLPYSLMAWAAGLLDMRWTTFLAVSLLRIVRVAGYFVLIKAGLSASGVIAGCDAPLSPPSEPISTPSTP